MAKDYEKFTAEELRTRIYELEGMLKHKESREYKSRLFSFIFGREEHKNWTLALYNAINGTRHSNPDDIRINTIEDAVYMGMKNDISILVSEIVNLYKSVELYEQQFSLNPNMPIRELMYACKSYNKYIYISKFNRYGTKLIPLPIPKLVCFYNGKSSMEDEVVLRLSDAYKEEIRRNVKEMYGDFTFEQIETEVEKVYISADPDIEAKVRMININFGHNAKLLSECKPLAEYSWFVAKIREFSKPDEYGKRLGIEESIDKSIKEMLDAFVIKEYLVANMAEVKDMCLTEYNEAETMEMFKEEGREEGLKLAKTIYLLFTKGYGIDKISSELKISENIIAEILDVFY